VNPGERQHPRYAVDVAIKVQYGTLWAEGRTLNLSRGGLAADLGVTLPVGKDVELLLTLVFEDQSTSEELRLPARIVWCTQVADAYQIGVSFRPLDKERAEYLALFLKYVGGEKAGKTPKAANVDDRFG
jgi:hypothetical protein